MEVISTELLNTSAHTDDDDSCSHDAADTVTVIVAHKMKQIIYANSIDDRGCDVDAIADILWKAGETRI